MWLLTKDMSEITFEIVQNVSNIVLPLCGTLFPGCNHMRKCKDSHESVFYKRNFQ